MKKDSEYDMRQAGSKNYNTKTNIKTISNTNTKTNTRTTNRPYMLYVFGKGMTIGI